MLGLVLAAILFISSDLHGFETPIVRLLATALVAALVAPHIVCWWRSRIGTAVFLLWVVLNLSNLVSPLRSVHSMLDVTSTVLCVVIVYEAARLLDGDRIRRWLTGYLTILLMGALAGRAASALGSGSFSLSELRVDTTAAGVWKGIVILSPCPVRWLPARLAFTMFKVVLVLLMLTVDRPKIGVLLALSLAAAVGTLALLLHRAAKSRNVMLMCFTILPVASIPALALGNLLLQVYVRNTDFSGRTVLWKAALEEVEQTRSLLGVGFRNSLSSDYAVPILERRFGPNFDSGGGNAVHNVYLQLLVEFGLVGVALVVTLLVVAIVGLIRVRSVSLQAFLAVDLLYVLGLWMAEPVLEPNRVIFVLFVLTMVRIRRHSVRSPDDVFDGRPPVSSVGRPPPPDGLGDGGRLGHAVPT